MDDLITTYSEALEYLYARLPMFTRDGAVAFKKGLDRTLAFCAHLGKPQTKFKSIHIAGTNGKGSSSHMLTSVLEKSGYKTGLYTSPHLVDFRERIRIHGVMVSEDYVIDFVRTHRAFIEDIQPSFFEVTVAMAFDFFAREHVDIAVIEVGLGGRLDSTNVIQPLLSLITNIGFDHVDMLGDTLEAIATQKAGIIKPSTPVVISEEHPATAPVFQRIADEQRAPITFASRNYRVSAMPSTEEYLSLSVEDNRATVASSQGVESVKLDLKGAYQAKNVAGVLEVIRQLNGLGFPMAKAQILEGLQSVQRTTGLMGRWQRLSEGDPRIIVDTGHNADGIREVVRNLQQTSYARLHVVLGAMRDKDLSHMLPQLPKDAQYYFAAPDMPRALPAEQLSAQAATHGLQGIAFASVEEALEGAKANYQSGDLIFVGGSTFVVAEVLQRSESAS